MERTRLKKTSGAVSVVGILALLIGCGGGGGGGSSSSGTSATTSTSSNTTATTSNDTTTATTSSASTTSSSTTTGSTATGNPVSNAFETYTLTTQHPSIVYTYNLAGTVSNDSGTTNQLLVNSIRQEFVTQGGTGNPPLLLKTLDNLAVASGTVNSISFTEYATQGSSRSIVLDSTVNGNTRTFSSPQTSVPGTFPSTFTNTLSYTDGGTPATVTFTVVDKEDVTVPYGSYETYKVTGGIDYGNGYSRQGTYYYVPQLGGYIKAVETLITPTERDTVTASLVSIDTPTQ